jgi:hypothetical protein
LRQFDPDAVGFMSAQRESGRSDSNRNRFSTEWPTGDNTQTFPYEKAELRETFTHSVACTVARWIDGGDIGSLVDSELAQA